MTIQEILRDIQKNNITDIIFDFDETISTLHINWGRWADQIAEAVRQFEPDYQTAVSARPIDTVTRKHGADFRKHIIQANAQFEGENYNGHIVNPLALELVKECAKVCRVHLWTSNNKETVQPLLDELHISELFDKKIFFNDVMYIKPDPDGFRHININRLPVEQFLFVGDSVSDRGACEAVGMRFFDVRDITSV